MAKRLLQVFFYMHVECSALQYTYAAVLNDTYSTIFFPLELKKVSSLPFEGPLPSCLFASSHSVRPVAKPQMYV